MYPASRIPLETMASAWARTVASSIFPAKWFQLFHPIGGVVARPPVCAIVGAVNFMYRRMQKKIAKRLRSIQYIAHLHSESKRHGRNAIARLSMIFDSRSAPGF